MAVKFHLFSSLPVDLRLEIWNTTFLPRVIELHAVGGQWTSSCLNHVAFSVNREARDESLRHYHRTLSGVTSVPLFFNPSFDTLVFLGHYDFLQLSNLFKALQPQHIGLHLARLQPSFALETLPRWRQTFFSANEQPAVFVCEHDIPPVGLRGEWRLELNHLYTFAGYVVNSHSTMPIMNLTFVPRKPLECEALSNINPDENLEVEIRFGRKAMSCPWKDLDGWFKCLVSLSTTFGQSLPLLEVRFAMSETRSLNSSVLQICSAAFTAADIYDLLNMWDSHNPGLTYAYVVKGDGLTIRVSEGSNTMTIQNVTASSGTFMHIIAPITLGLIEMVHRQAMITEVP